LIHRNVGNYRRDKFGARVQSNAQHHTRLGRSMSNWPQLVKELSALLRNLRGGAPEVMKAFAGIAQAASVSKALDAKTKELIALGIAVAVRCDDCIAFHTKAAAEHGATRDEVSETLGMAIYMGAGPSVMYASHALEAFTQFETSVGKQPAPVTTLA
jgi:AhpD family alkylhydroperoxidase